MAAIVEKRFNYKGFPCVVLMQDGGFRTGYVGLPPTHKFYNIQYMNILPTIYCHGGLTYSNAKLVHQDDENTWWIGFDCYHYGDMKDYDAAFELFKDDETVLNFLKKDKEWTYDNNWFGEVCSLEFCEKECKKIVDQII